MADDDVAAFMRAIDAWNRGDLEGWVAAFDPEGEWEPGLVRVEYVRPIAGHDGIRRAWKDLHSAFEVLTPSYDEVTDTGDAVLALGRLSGRSESGVPVDPEHAVVARYRAGLAVSVRSFTSHAEARAAASLPP